MFRKRAQPKDEPRWIAHPAMAPTEPQDIPSPEDIAQRVHNARVLEFWARCRQSEEALLRIGKALELSTITMEEAGQALVFHPPQGGDATIPIPRVDDRLIGREQR